MLALLVKWGILKYFQKKLEKKWKVLKVEIDTAHRYQPPHSFIDKQKKKVFQQALAKQNERIEQRKQISAELVKYNQISAKHGGYTSPTWML